jgi:REP element-mobilizing transposase RayT
MARPLRIQVAGGWYHVTARGQRRDVIFDDAGDYRKFLDMVADMRTRYRVRIRAYCLMPNHYHLLVSTPDGNLSQAMHWLNVSYSRWVNTRRRQVGPVFQGRYHAVLLETGYGLAVSSYVHMNPVWVCEMGLGKRRKAAEGQGLVGRPAPEELKKRVETLRTFRWSSYGAYAGYEKSPPWLDRGAVLAMVKGGEAGYRELVEEQILQKEEENLGSRIRWGLVLGGAKFARKVRGKIRIARESVGRGELKERRTFEEIVQMVEGIKREKRTAFWDRYGDWGRDLVLWGARMYGGLTLAELGREAGGMDYSAVSMATVRVVQMAKKDRSLRQAMAVLKTKCEKG